MLPLAMNSAPIQFRLLLAQAVEAEGAAEVRGALL
jgi:hypothetical protein